MKIELTSSENTAPAKVLWSGPGQHECGTETWYCPQMDLGINGNPTRCRITDATGPSLTDAPIHMTPAPTCPLHKALTQLDKIYADYKAAVPA